MSEAKTYNFKVTALSPKGHRYDSDWSNPLEYTIAPVQFAYMPLEMKGLQDKTAWQIKIPDKNVAGKVVIPTEIAGKPVMKIYAGGFADCKNLTSVYIPDCVLYIDSSAFSGCTNLTRVRLPENLDKLSLGVFENSGLKSISIPSTVESIGNLAFSGCDYLTELVIPEGVKETGLSVFANSNNLKSITIPKSLESITISEKFAHINGTFNKTPALSEIKVADGNPVYKSEGNCLIKREENLLVYGCKSSVIPDYVQEIGEEAFYGSDIESIVIPKNVSKIDYTAFVGCLKLKKISVAEDNPVFKVDSNCLIIKADNSVLYGYEPCVIPDYVKSIAEGGFYGCKIESIVIPDSVDTIGETAFNVCIRLKEVTLSSNLKTLPKNFMAKCSLLEKITIPYGVTTINSGCFTGCTNLKEVYIPDSVEKMKNAFASCNLLDVTIPDSVTEIVDSSFYNGINSLYISYIMYDEIPEGWETFKAKSLSNKAGYVSNCQLRYDGHYPYVYSFECSDNLLWKSLTRSYCIIPPHRKGYTFVGWTTKEGSAKVVYPVFRHSTYNTMTTLSWEEQKTISKGDVLYAVWIPVTE